MTRIDVHSHAVPANWKKYCMDLGYGESDGVSDVLDWTPEAHIAVMDRAGINHSVLSITSPGTHLVPDDHVLGRDLTRETNIDLSKISKAHPDRFSFFASLPLPDVAGSIAEIDYALDNLGAKGFAVMTNAHGIYLGDPSLDAVFEKFNARGAVVFMHPTCCRIRSHSSASLTTSQVQPLPTPHPSFINPMLEFPFDTTRAVASLLCSGTLHRYPNIKYIIPHCGAALPPLLSRITGYVNQTFPGTSPSVTLSPEEVKKVFQTRVFFDLAGYPFPDQIYGLLRFVGPDRLLYGTDHPFYKEVKVHQAIKDMDIGMRVGQDGKGLQWDEETIKGVLGGNVKKLLWSDLKSNI
ncbi:hypothetical protein B7463_g4060, partial [Scytalidium lignicola]